MLMLQKIEEARKIPRNSIRKQVRKLYISIWCFASHDIFFLEILRITKKSIIIYIILKARLYVLTFNYDFKLF